MAASNNKHRISERLQQDRRSTTELIEAALVETEPREDLPEGYLPIAVLHQRGSRDVLDAALASCISPDPRRRALGADILGQLGSPERTFPEECCDALLHLLRQDTDRRVLIAAVFALGHLGNRRGEPGLIALRDHADGEVRHGVAFALCGTDRPASVQALLELMEDPYGPARDWATTGISQAGSIDGAGIRAALLRRASDADEVIRAEALHGLARRRDERVILYLVAELAAAREKAHLFQDAAKTFLGMDEATKVDPAAMLAALRSRGA